MKTICYLLVIALSFNLVGCDQINLPSGLDGFSVPEIRKVTFDNSSSNLREVAPPNVIQKLDRTLAKYQPQITILSPRSHVTLQDTSVEVNLAVEGYPLFKDEQLGMGNHLYLTLDDEPYGEIYNLDKPIVLKDLKPGTHSLRVLAEKPWHESFHNPEAYAQVSFNVLTETEDNNPNRDLPLLTYNQPTGIYSAEPILLDFYLTNPQAEDWQVKAIVNGESFIIDQWQPTYLQGFKEGNNLIELELLNGEGKKIKNVFNKTIRLISYQNQDSSLDTLAKLMTDRITFEEAVAIAEQNYYIQPVSEPEIGDTLTEEPSIAVPEVVEEPKVEVAPEEISAEVTKEIIPQEKSSEVEEVIEKATEEISETKTEEEAKAVADQIRDAIKKAEEKSINETTSETVTKPQFEEKKVETSQSFSQENNVATTSVIQEQKNSSNTLEEVKEIPIPETVRSVETAEDIITSEAEESEDTLTIEIPKPKKLKVPQWWKDLVAKIQQLFNVN